MRWVLSARRVRSSLRLALFSQGSADGCSTTNEPGKENRAGSDLVETMGIEPTTPCLQSRCSSQLSYVPVVGAPSG